MDISLPEISASGAFDWLSSTWGKITASVATIGTLGFMAWLTALPVIGPIIRFVGVILQAIGEIILSMSKSPEGRVALGVIVAVLGFLYMRYHFIEEGRAMGRSEVKTEYARPAPIKRVR